MPIVFVHGVNVRKDEHYNDHVQARDTYLQQYVVPMVLGAGATTQIFTPYWGEWGAKLAWHHASLPTVGQERFGPADEWLATLLGPQAGKLAAEQDKALVILAHASLRDVVDLLFAQALQQARPEQMAALVALSAKANNYAEQNPKPPWLQQVQDDQDFYTELRRAIDGWTPVPVTATDGTQLVVVESFGLADQGWNALRSGYVALRQGIGNLTGRATALLRTPVHKAVSIFLGDVFEYIQDRGTVSQPGPIVQAVVAELDKASAQRQANDPLIVLAHSMGGNICYDIFSYFRPDLVVDAFVTVGSQVALLAELNLYQKKYPGLPTDYTVDRRPKPTNVKRWLNVYDTNDVLSFACAGVFADVVDYEYLSGSTLVGAHTMYFQRSSFYQRLADRLGRVAE